MKNSSFFERIQFIIDTYFDGNQTAFAKGVDIPQSTLHRILKGKDEKNLVKQYANIIEALPFIDSDWLLRGEGNPPDQGPFLPALSACNRDEKPVGDFIRDFLDFYEITNDEVVKFTGISPQRLDAILSSRQYPDFHFLEMLYRCFGFNPAFCFHGDHKTMSDPKDSLERALKAIGDHRKFFPSHRELERLFGATKEEAKEFLVRCRQAKQNIHEYGRIALEEGELETEDGEPILGFPILPSAWVDYFKQHLVFNSGWIRDRNAHPAIWEERRVGTNPSQRHELEKKLADLNGELAEAHKEHAQALKQIIELERQLRLAVQSPAVFPSKEVTVNLATSKTAVHGVPQVGMPE